jgi:hypothetical protein
LTSGRGPNRVVESTPSLYRIRPDTALAFRGERSIMILEIFEGVG